MQVSLPQTASMQLTDHPQSAGQQRLARGIQLIANALFGPGGGQALGAVEVVEQQPTAAILLAVSQQLRGVQALLSKQTRALHFTLKMPRSLAAHQQLGQHRTTTPSRPTDITLTGQHPQQAVQLQTLAIRQFDQQRQRRRAPGAGQFSEIQRRASLLRWRAFRRWRQAGTPTSEPT